MTDSDAWFMACGFGIAALVILGILTLGVIGQNLRRGNRDH